MKTTATATFIQYFDMCVCCMQCVCFIVVLLLLFLFSLLHFYRLEPLTRKILLVCIRLLLLYTSILNDLNSMKVSVTRPDGKK